MKFVTIAIFALSAIILFWPESKEAETSSKESSERKSQVKRANSKNSSNLNSPNLSSTDQNLKNKNTGNRINSARISAKAQGLSLAELQDLGDRYRNEKDEKVRAELFEKLLSNMTAENALDIRKFIEDLDQDNPEFIAFHKAFGAVAGAEAVFHGEETKKRDMAVTLQGWADADPEGALAWFNSLQDTKRKNYAQKWDLVEGVLKGLMKNNTDQATDFLLGSTKLHDYHYRKMAHLLANDVLQGSTKNGDVDAAKAWSDDLPSGKLKTYAQGMIAHELASKDPAEAVAWIDEMSEKGGTSSHTYEMATKAWAKKDASATVDWLASLDSNQHNLQNSYYHAFNNWSDVGAASQYLENMPDSENRNSAVGGLSVNLAKKNPDQAMQWATTITEPKKRYFVVMATSQIGFSKNTEGLKKWLPKSGLSKKEQAQVLKNHYRKRKR